MAIASIIQSKSLQSAVNGVSATGLRNISVLVKSKLVAAKNSWKELADSAREIKRSHLVPSSDS